MLINQKYKTAVKDEKKLVLALKKRSTLYKRYNF